MSSNPFAEPLDIEIRPSRIVATLLCAMHLTAAIVCAQLPMPMLYRGGLVLAVFSAFFWNGYSYTRRSPRRLCWSREQGWRLAYRDGDLKEVELLPESHLGPWMTVAHFRSEDRKRHTVLLARDSASGETLRRLRVLLRYGTPRR